LCGERMSGGSAFQTIGAAMEKLRWPMDVFARETNRSPRPLVLVTCSLLLNWALASQRSVINTT